ncbi:T9SS type A sorting domain-containing protein [Flaviramulus sp. BrNp1-15]|uniref:T9SS type A sorting domain-containing protein n=1 Tax=Flaviramulus sp. BrNp1-15 TaxID=2916754 RepID=UPI001EE82DE8|nr:T9SS type A sorting domain-containing protein [Flaviramulus sp. BrNp1-15]ULC57941.1 T9SS type A sorting domain-containing protein [Flaviramulus sp. BrNp1-15]
MNIKSTTLILLLCPYILLAQWLQIGNDIDGENTNNQSGYTVSLSADGNTIVIGAPFNADNGSASGHVRVFENNANVWQQKGNDIDGIAASDKFGFSVSISADGNTIAVGAPDNNANGFESGHVRVFNFQVSDWVQVGTDIIGEDLSDHSGYSVSLSDDGNRLAIGAPDNGLVENVGSNYGQVRVYENQSNNWVQIGSDIDGEDPEDNSGYAVSLNEDGSIVAIGAPNNSNATTGAGHVRVYNYQSTNWVQIGADIDGEGMNDKFGGAVSLNNAGNILAVGAVDNNGIGHVRVFENQSNTWVQIGNDIDGEAINDEFGISVSLNGNGTILAVGARYNSDFASDAGHVRVYKNELGNWQQIDSDIVGEALQDRSGVSVSLNDDGNIVAIGAYLNDGNGSNSGHARLFSNSNILNIESINSIGKIIAYPNPVTNQIYIELEKIVENSKVQLYNIEGKLLYTQDYNGINHLMIDMHSFSKGIYILKLQLDKIQKTLKVIKQ